MLYPIDPVTLAVNGVMDDLRHLKRIKEKPPSIAEKIRGRTLDISKYPLPMHAPLLAIIQRYERGEYTDELNDYNDKIKRI